MCEASVKVDEKAIAEGNRKLNNALWKSKLCRNEFQTAQSMIEMGIKRKVDVTEELNMLRIKKTEITAELKLGSNWRSRYVDLLKFSLFYLKDSIGHDHKFH